MKKENVYVEVRTEKQAKKLKKVLDMFGENHSAGCFCNIHEEWVNIYFNASYKEFYLSNNNEGCDKISIKQLRNILALEHLKKGDVVVVKGSDTGIKRVGVVNSFSYCSADEISIYSDNFTDLDQKEPEDGLFGFSGNFIRYATDEEKELLKPKQQTAEEKVIEYAKSVDWDFDKVVDFVGGNGLNYSLYMELEGDFSDNKTQIIFDKHKPRDNKSFTDSDIETIEQLHDQIRIYGSRYDSNLLTKARELSKKIKNNLELQSE